MNETPKQFKQRRAFELAQKRRAIKLIDKAIDALYCARMENNGAVLTLPIKDLHVWLVANDGK
jgi:hypothetical protein